MINTAIFYEEDNKPDLAEFLTELERTEKIISVAPFNCEGAFADNQKYLVVSKPKDL